MWLTCISLDFLVGFRFELLWPLWLLIRHLYESCRVQTFASSLHYSAFSVFFVCITATSDLVCYLFIPVQVLLFIASTYVWVQFVYQSSDRGVCFPSLILWTLFIIFEYSMRYRFDNATWYLTRTSWITAGLFPSTADSISVGSPAPSSFSSSRLEVYRPFAAHCVGYPIVTLGFRVKSFFSSWRMRRRREEVMKKNEFYEKLLAEALPSTYEGRRQYHSVRQQMALEHHLAEYEIAAPSSSMEGYDVRSYATAVSPQLAICGASGGSITTTTTVTKKPGQKASTKSVTKPQNGPVWSGGNGIPYRRGCATGSRSGWRSDQPMGVGGELGVGSGSRRGSDEAPLLDDYPQTPTSFALPRFLCNLVLSTIIYSYDGVSAWTTRTVGRLLFGTTDASDGLMNQDDLISTSGDGSHVADEEDSDREEDDLLRSMGPNYSPPTLTGGGQSKRKSRSARARTNTSKTDSSDISAVGSTSASLINQNTCISSAQSTNSLTPPSNATASTATVQNQNPPISNGTVCKTASNGHLPAAGGQNGIADKYATSNGSLIENLANSNDMKQLLKEKETLEQMLEKYKNDIKHMRNGEMELRSELRLAQQQERTSRHELTQTKNKCEQLEAKLKQFTKQTDQSKSSITDLEKRVSDLLKKKTDLERELATEKNASKLAREESLKSIGFSDTDNFKSKMNGLEREVKALKRDLRAKDETVAKMDEELKRLRSRNQRSEEETQLKQITALKERNARLEQTLSAENRLKQDLFRALNSSKAEIEALNARLSNYEKNNNSFREDVQKATVNGDGLFPGHHSPSSGMSPFNSHSMTPTPPTSSVSNQIDLDQLMHVTGAHYMCVFNV
ncbi:Macoilin [Aphelenchoides avenae]|nr:Macoilin [Aphelenchus avenae]